MTDDQASGAQEPEMLGDRRAAAPKVCSNLTDCKPIVTQESKDLSASRISYGTKNRVSAPMLYGNHLVTEIVTEWLRLSTSRSPVVLSRTTVDYRTWIGLIGPIGPIGWMGLCVTLTVLSLKRLNTLLERFVSDEAFFPVRKKRNTALSLAPQQNVGRFRKASHTRFTKFLNNFLSDVERVSADTEKHFQDGRGLTKQVIYASLELHF